MAGSYLECEFRACLPLDHALLKARKRLIEVFEHELLEDPGEPLKKELKKTHTAPCCCHKNAPWVPFGGIRDPFLCEAAIESDRCPMGHKPDEIDPNWRKAKLW